MARAIRWTGSFVTIGGTECVVNIYDEGWNGGTTALTLADNPFTFDEDDSSDLLDAVRIKTGYIRVVEDTYGALTDIYPQTDTEHYITLAYGSAVVFSGFMQSQSFDQEYKAGPRVLSIPVVSALGITSGLRFAAPSVPSYRTLCAILKDAIDLMNAGVTKVTFPDYIVSNTERVLSLQMNTLSYCPFNDNYNIYVGSTETLYNPKTVYDFIDALCHCFGLMVHDLGTEIVFTRYDYTGVYNQYIVDTMDSSSPSYQAITNGSTVLTISLPPKSADSTESTIMPVSKVSINYEDDVYPTYEIPYNRTKAHTYGDNWVLLTPSTDEITSSNMATGSMPTPTSNNVAVCATNGAESDGGFKEMIMFSRVTGNSELFTWKLYNIPKYSNQGCKLSFSLKAVTWHEVDGKYYYDKAAAKAKSVGVRIKNGTFYLQSNGTWAASPEVIYRNTGGTDGDSDVWQFTFRRAMNTITSPLEVTFFYGGNSESVGLYAIEDVKIEPITKGITSYIQSDNSNHTDLTSNNGSKAEASVSQTINVKRKSEDALVNANGGFYSMLTCSYNYMFTTQYRIDYETFIIPNVVYYTNKILIGASGIRRRVIGFKVDLWNEKATVMAQGSKTL